jgi:putative phosphoesterase
LSKLVGILADVHGDLQALDAALARLRKMGCDAILCAGDCIDFEVFGEEVIQRLKAEKAICIRGNHDRWALRPDSPEARAFTAGVELSREALAWLAALPAHWSAELEGVRVAMYHACPDNDMEGIQKETTPPELRRRLLEQARADVLIVGHTHDAFVLRAGRGRIVNPGACCSKAYAFKLSGSLLVPDKFRPPTFGVLELPEMRFKVYRAVDGGRVFGTSPDRPSIRRAGG